MAEEDIVADYQVSYTYNANGINRMIERIPELKEYLIQAGEDSMLHSNPKNIRAVLEVLNAGNIAAWLERAGVGRERQDCFRQIMLEG